MTYRSRGRSVFEVIVVSHFYIILCLNPPTYLNYLNHSLRCDCLFQAICFVAFLVGFILVLCIGNYYRAKRAAERQRQRRLTKLSESNAGKPERSSFFGNSSSSVNRGDGSVSDIGSYEPPRLQAGSTGLA